MTDKYIKVPGIYNKLKLAEKQMRIIYISSPAGVGKTAAVEYFLRNKSYISMSGIEGYLQEKALIQKMKPSVIVIDDISWIIDDVSQDYILRLIQESGTLNKQLILIGRSKIPSWLKKAYIDYGFLLADERDLMLGEAQIRNLFEAYDISLESQDVHRIMEDTKGYSIALLMIITHMMGGVPYGEEVIQAAALDTFHYFENSFYDQWDDELRQVLMPMACFPNFTIQLAEMVSGNGHIPALLEKSRAVGDFLIKNKDDAYEYRPVLKDFFNWKMHIEYDKTQMKEIYERAALYYEIQGEVQEALHYYEEADNQNKISRLLLKNAEKHPGHGHFFETRQYYLNLPKELVLTSPMLMSGMSILHSLLMQQEESEYWYQLLAEFEKKQHRGGRLRREAASRLAYLDIALLHRGISNIILILKNAAILSMNKEIYLSEFSITSNLPSVMNGGLDFCKWSKNDRELARVMKKPVEVVLGKSAVGLVNIALAESTYEKSYEGQKSLDDYEILTLLNSGYSMAESRGCIEMCFAAIGLMVKEHISHNQLQLAKNLISEFRKKALTQGAKQLLPNVDAMQIWICLVEGDTTTVDGASMEQWLQEEAPNENQEFFIMERYRYLVKIRVYITMGCYNEAMQLIERVHVYFESYHRTYMWIQNQLLKAVVQYRLGIGKWKDSLQNAISKAEEYRFIKVVAEEGAAIKQLIEQHGNLIVEKEYHRILIQEVNRMALAYPDYLKEKHVLGQALTNMEETVLRLLCKGMKNKEISETCNISYNTLKYHNKNLYRKLGAKNRPEAERIARELGLV